MECSNVTVANAASTAEMGGPTPSPEAAVLGVEARTGAHQQRTVLCMDDHLLDEQFSPSAAKSYQLQADKFIEALRRHVALTLGREGRMAELPAYGQSAEQLADAGASFDHAELRWCGSIPLGVQGFSDADDDRDEDALAEEATDVGEGEVLSGLGRWDFRVVDAEALMLAGRAAYASNWPQDTVEDAEVAVSDIRRAASELVHAGGWSALQDAPGLNPDRAVTIFVTHAGTDNAGWDQDPFAILDD
jgi:hypothetical protein